MRIGNCFANPGELVIEQVFELSVIVHVFY
jgi:hypothetical protein